MILEHGQTVLNLRCLDMQRPDQNVASAPQSALKLMARGRVAPPPPFFWVPPPPPQERSTSASDGEDLIFRMDPLPDDLDPEE